MTERDYIIKDFPELAKDKYFQISSKVDPTYNCIAWACIKNDIYYWPAENYKSLDGVYWPDDLPVDTKLDTFVQLFNKQKYEVCQSWKFEDGFNKIAIYQNKNGEVTHASRQLFNGIWTSKLGPRNDIYHMTPFGVEGTLYGNATTFMKRENSGYLKSRVKPFVETV